MMASFDIDSPAREARHTRTSITFGSTWTSVPFLVMVFRLGRASQKLAEATGGRMLEVKGMDKLNAALDEISDELHHQYSLGYYPEKQDWDGKFRKIQIVTQQQGYKVYARKGYYAHPRYQAMQ
jgi:VWFA-related protein